MNSFEGPLPNEVQGGDGQLPEPQEPDKGLQQYADEAFRVVGTPFADLAERVDDITGDRRSWRMTVSHAIVPTLVVTALAGVGVAYRATEPLVGPEVAATGAVIALVLIMAMAALVRDRLRKPYTTPREDQIARGETEPNA